MTGIFRKYVGCFTIALILCGLYAGITLIPLAPLVLKSPRIAHVVTGECSGDCDIDGCSPASRATRTCCCVQKRLQPELLATKGSEESCCATLTRVNPKLEPSCCEAVEPEPVPTRSGSCCDSNDSNTRQPALESTEAESDRHRQTVYRCGSPCGGKLLNLSGFGKTELLPCSHSGCVPAPSEEVITSSLVQRLTSRHADPPVPPPKLFPIA